MSSEILELYFRIVIAYLKDDDGIIDSREYKELISLMTKIKVSKQLANDLRKYRFEDKEDLTIEELIDQLKNQTNKDNFSEAAVEQTLAMDIIGMNSDKLDTIKDDEVLVRMLNRLNISDKQLKFIVRKIKADKEIIESRMTDSEIKEVNKELAAVASGAGLVALGLLTSGGTVYLGIIAVLAFTEELNTFLVQEKQRSSVLEFKHLMIELANFELLTPTLLKTSTG